MKESAPLCFVLVCAIVLIVTAKDTDAKKGCAFYGHSCYGGHGKRSLTPTDNEVVGQTEEKLQDTYPMQMFPNEQEERILEKYPRYRLVKLLKTMMRTPMGKSNDFDSNEFYNGRNMK